MDKGATELPSISPPHQLYIQGHKTKIVFTFSLHWHCKWPERILPWCRFYLASQLRGLPMWLSGKQPASQCRRRNTYRFDPWVGKIPWRWKWQLASSILAWKIPWTEEPGGLQSMGSQRVRHKWSDWVCMQAKAFKSQPRGLFLHLPTVLKEG